MPGSWYDPTDTDNGFTGITASSSQYKAYAASQSSQYASRWYNGHSSSTGGSAGAMVFGVTFGASASHSDSEQHSGADSSGTQSSQFGSEMSSVTIKLEYGLCTIYRPWLLRQLFVTGGWYLPNEKDNVISDGTIGGQKSDDDAHLLPMIPTQFLVVRNVSIEASGWGAAGDQMSQYCTHAEQNDEASSTSVSGGVGFLCFGGSVSRQNADWSGDEAESAAAAGSWHFSGNSAHGKLTINGCQIVGWIGEIVPASPKLDGTKQSAAAATNDSGSGDQSAKSDTASGDANSGAAAAPAAVH